MSIVDILTGMMRTAEQTRAKGKAALAPYIRVSAGTAMVLELQDRNLDADPTTAYLMTYHEGKCVANCSFCPQARTSTSREEMLSRVTWPTYPTEAVLQGLERKVREGRIGRVCVQTLNYPGVFDEVCAFVKNLKSRVFVPVSVSCQPMNSENMWQLKESGVDRIGIALDAATEILFDKVKGASAGGPYRWREVQTLLRVALGVFGEGNVSTHLIVGLGETEKEMIQAVQDCVDSGVLPALFAFTPVKGTRLVDRSQPEIGLYRRVQLARYLIVNGLVQVEDMRFDGDGGVIDFGMSGARLGGMVKSGLPFLTSGCPGCNRPFYNEKPGGPLYNYPRDIGPDELELIERELKL